MRLERSTPIATAELKNVFEQCLDLCEFKASTKNLLELTGLPQKTQNSEYITCFTTFLERLVILSLILGLGMIIMDVFGLYSGRKMDNVGD